MEPQSRLVWASQLFLALLVAQAKRESNEEAVRMTERHCEEKAVSLSWSGNLIPESSGHVTPGDIKVPPHTLPFLEAHAHQARCPRHTGKPCRLHSRAQRSAWALSHQTPPTGHSSLVFSLNFHPRTKRKGRLHPSASPASALAPCVSRT